MGDRLKDKVAIVTGSGRGIGRGIALALAEEGAKVVVNDPGVAADGGGGSGAPADEVVAEIKQTGGVAVANYDSVATTEGGENIIKAALDNFGRIDILVNNAGILRDRMIFNMAPEEWDAVIKVHLYGVFNCSKPAAVLMRQQRGGRIINLVSAAGLSGHSGQANYSAAKGGIAGFTRTCALDLGKYGITVNAIAPGAATRMTTSDEFMEAIKIRAERGLGGGRQQQQTQAAYQLPPAEDIAPIVVYLATDAAADINGVIFSASGGNISRLCNPTAVKSISKEGRWTLDELLEQVPKTLAEGLVNPAPAQPPKE